VLRVRRCGFRWDFERLRGSGRGFGFRGGCRCFYRRGIIGCVSRGGITLRRFALGVFPWLPGIIAFAIPGSAIHRTFRRQVGLIFRAGFCLLHFQQALPIRHGNLVVIRVDFAKGQEAVAIAAIFHKGRLQAGFHPHHFGQVDIALQCAALRRFKIKFVEAIAIHHHNPGFLGVGCIYQHTLGHGVESPRRGGAAGANAWQGPNKDRKAAWRALACDG